MPVKTSYQKLKDAGKRVVAFYVDEAPHHEIMQAAAVEGCTTVAAWARQVLIDRAREVLRKKEKRD